MHAQKKIGRRQVEHAQRVRLQKLRQAEHAAQTSGVLRDRNGQNRIASLGRRDEMAHRADAADPSHQ
jgi:hypothetical protein